MVSVSVRDPVSPPNVLTGDTSRACCGRFTGPIAQRLALAPPAFSLDSYGYSAVSEAAQLGTGSTSWTWLLDSLKVKVKRT